MVFASARPDTVAMQTKAPASVAIAANKRTVRLDGGFTVVLLLSCRYLGFWKAGWEIERGRKERAN